MKKIILTAATVSLGIMFAAAGTASAETRSTTAKRATAPIINIASLGSSTGMRENVAKEWTAGCYAEFGPDATHPDAALLEKCLN